MFRVRFPFIALLCIVTVASAINGCATIMRGSKQQVQVTSSPSAAKVVITRIGTQTVVFDGTTPATVMLPKNHEYTATVSLDGYKDATTNITKDGIEGWFWGNIICGGLIGIIVDVSNGAMNKLGPDEIDVSLVTAYLPGGEEVLYALFRALDSKGQLRSYSIPMMRDTAVGASAALAH